MPLPLPGTSIAHSGIGDIELREVFFETRRKFGSLAIKRFFVGLGYVRDKQRIRDSGAVDGRMQPEMGISNHFNIVKESTNGSTHHHARIIDIDAFAHAIRAARPSGVDEVATHLMSLNALAQEVSILDRRQREEGRAKAGTERCLWSSYASFRSSQLTCVAGQKVVHCLLHSQFGNWR